MNTHNYESADGKVRIERTQENCEVRTRIKAGMFGYDHEHITLSCPPLELEHIKERLHGQARQRTTIRRKP